MFVPLITWRDPLVGVIFFHLKPSLTSYSTWKSQISCPSSSVSVCSHSLTFAWLLSFPLTYFSLFTSPRLTPTTHYSCHPQFVSPQCLSPIFHILVTFCPTHFLPLSSAPYSPPGLAASRSNAYCPLSVHKI